LELVDPDLVAALELLPDLGSISHETLADVRRLLAEGRQAEPIAGVTTEWVVLDGIDGSPDLPALLQRPTTPGPHPAILNLHGGGFVAGTAAREEGPMQLLCAALDAVILSVEYRLAPEHPFPAALDDAWTGLRWIHGTATELGIDTARIAVRGVSAGGGIAAGLAKRKEIERGSVQDERAGALRLGGGEEDRDRAARRAADHMRAGNLKLIE